MFLQRIQVGNCAASVSGHAPLLDGASSRASLKTGYDTLPKSRTMQRFRLAQTPFRSILRGAVDVGDQKDVQFPPVKSGEMSGRSELLRKLD